MLTSARRPNSAAAPSAFTLVELLVVLAVVAILIALLLPALNKAKLAAKQINCGANLRTMGQAMTMYVVETRFYPGHAVLSRGGTPFAVWPTRLRAMLRGRRDVFWCPAQEESLKWPVAAPGNQAGLAGPEHTGYGYRQGEMLLDVFRTPFSYGYNDWGRWNVRIPQRGLGADLWQPNSRELRAGQVRKPADMIAIADNTADGSWDFNIDPTNAREYPGNVHNKGANVLFCDGHVQWYRQVDLVNVNSTAGQNIARMWNNDNGP